MYVFGIGDKNIIASSTSGTPFDFYVLFEHHGDYLMSNDIWCQK